jgi:hypothetical protein
VVEEWCARIRKIMGELNLIRSPEVFRVLKGGGNEIGKINRLLSEKHNICQI